MPPRKSNHKIAINALESHPRNSEHRAMSDDERSALRESITQGSRHHKSWNFKDGYRLDCSVTINHQHGESFDGCVGRVLGGHRRLEVLQELGQDWIHKDDVTWVDYPPDSAEELACLIKLNNPHSGGTFTAGTEALLNDLRSLMAPETFEALSFNLLSDDIAVIGDSAEEDVKSGNTDVDDIPEPPDDATTNPGDIWILGNHRLMCGDSSNPEDLDMLLDGAVIHLTNTDPPYNVKVEPRSNNAIAAGLSSFPETQSKSTHKKLRPKDRPLENDFVTDEEFDVLLDAWFGNISRVLTPGGSFYIWGGYANLGNYPPFLKKNKLYFSQGIVWDKQHPVLTRKDFMGSFELAFYGWKEGAGHKYYGPNNATDLWHVKKVNPQSMIHLTEKPVELAVNAIQYSSKKGQNVLDLFGGSGSTLMGAEQTDRNAFLMEIDPLYCDVIVQRWENFTGKKAVLAKKQKTS